MKSLHNAAIALGKLMVRPFGKRPVEKLISFLATTADLDLLSFAYDYSGVVRWTDGDFQSTGERHVMEQILPRLLKSPAPVLFDVGAHTGNYSRALAAAFPQSTVYAFEPNPETFEQLKAQCSGPIRCVNLGLGAERSRQTIYTYPASGERASEHSSLFKEVVVDLHNQQAPAQFDLELTTLDEFCAKQGIGTIDFLKIDTEGNELNVLRGASKMLAEGRIQAVQFEFNSMNVVSRVFLRDFYQILPEFDLFRLHPKGLIPLKKYDVRNEIFVIQNFLAIKRTTADSGIQDIGRIQ